MQKVKTFISDNGRMKYRNHRFSIGLPAVLAFLASAPGCDLLDSIHEPTTAHHYSEVFGRSIEGREIRATVLGAGKETVLLLGVVHGNEPLGEGLLDRFILEAQANSELLRGFRVVVAPVVNPDGLARRTRHNARGVDLNRNFPAANWTPVARHGAYPGSEPETRAVLKLMRQFRPTRILAIHSPLDCVNFDGPAEPLARAIAAVTPFPLRASIGYPTPGSLGSYAGVDLRTPTITLELGPRVGIERAWRDTRDGLFTFVAPPVTSIRSAPYLAGKSAAPAALRTDITPYGDVKVGEPSRVSFLRGRRHD